MTVWWYFYPYFCQTFYAGKEQWNMDYTISPLKISFISYLSRFSNKNNKVFVLYRWEIWRTSVPHGLQSLKQKIKSVWFIWTDECVIIIIVQQLWRCKSANQHPSIPPTQILKPSKPTCSINNALVSYPIKNPYKFQMRKNILPTYLTLYA